MENSLLVIFDEIWPKTMYYNSTIYKWLVYTTLLAHPSDSVGCVTN